MMNLYKCPSCISAKIQHKVITRLNKYWRPQQTIEKYTWCEKLRRYLHKQVTICPYYQNRRLDQYV